ncbi:MAG: hypothetical protein MZV63_03175 [Marinilabiliales bacterium]|nr:hypothetical protein [Marinilabiliales bacterium]
MKDVGGWFGLKGKACTYSAACKGLLLIHLQPHGNIQAKPHANPLGVEWFGILFGLGFVLSFGYWCTNFLIVQRAFAAESKAAARKVPLIGALPKMFIPFLIIVPGIICSCSF